MTHAADPAQTTWRKLSRAELDRVFQAHAAFRAARTGGKRADLSYCDLSSTHLSGRDLSDANLTATPLRQCRPVGPKLPNANLFSAALRLPLGPALPPPPPPRPPPPPPRPH